MLRAAGPTVVREWSVPVEVMGTALELTGDVTWVPEADAADRVRSAAAVEPEDGAPVLPWALGGGALAVLLAAAVAVRRAQGRRGGSVLAHTKRG